MLTHCLSFAETMCGLGKYDKTSQAAIDPEDTAEKTQKVYSRRREQINREASFHYDFQVKT